MALEWVHNLKEIEFRPPSKEMAAVALNEGLDYRVKSGKRIFRLTNPYQAALFRQPTDRLPDWLLDEVEALQQQVAYSASIGPRRDHSGIWPSNCEPMPFQIAGLEYALDRRHTIFGDPPGLGKTVQAIITCNALQAEKVVVVCPAAVRQQWGREIAKWSTRKSNTIHVVKGMKTGINPFANWIVVSYPLSAKEPVNAALHAYKPDIIIYDESHFLKSEDSQRTRAAFGPVVSRSPVYGLVHTGARILALTGTLLPNRPRECHVLVRSLDHEAIDYMGYESFADYYNPEQRLAGREITGHLRELNARLRSSLMVRRPKNRVLTQLPELMIEIVYAEEDASVRKALQAEKLVDFDEALGTVVSHGADGAIATARRLMGEALCPFALDYVQTLLDGEVKKLFVGVYHKSVMAEFKKKFPKAVCIDGSTTNKDAKLREFIDSPEIQLLVGQIISVGTGVDGLQKVCDRCLVVEPDWTPGGNQQFMDRLHRHGQQRGVLAQFLVAEGSISEKIMQRVAQKARIAGEVLD